MGRSTKKTPPDYLDDHESESPDGYEQVYAGKPFYEPAGVNWQLACCHCGLVHNVKVEHDGMHVDRSGAADVLRITMKENAAATKRHRKVPGEAPALDEAYRKGYEDAMRVVRLRRLDKSVPVRKAHKKAAP